MEASYLAYPYIWGRPTETSESYLILTYILYFIPGIHLHLGKTNKNQSTVSDVDLYFMVFCTLKKKFSFCTKVSFSVATRDRGVMLGIHLHLGKTN